MFKITAVVPTFNHEDYILDALDSLVAQNHPLNIVVVDDGSTDKSWKNLIKSCSKLKSMELDPANEPAEIQTGNYKGLSIACVRFAQNYGPAISRNYAIKSTLENTDIYAFLDSDDMYKPNKIKESLKYFAANSFCGIVYSDYSTLNIHNGSEQRQFKEPYSKERLKVETLPNMDSLIRAECFRKCGLFDESLRVCEDRAMYIEISKKYLITHIPNDLLTIRIGKHSSSSTVPKEVWGHCYRKAQERFNN